MLKQYSDMEKQINKQLDKYSSVQGLMIYIDVNSLYKIHEKQKGDKATGIDKAHKYRPLPVRRVEIPKPNGKTRNGYYKVDYVTSKKKSKLKYKAY